MFFLISLRKVRGKGMYPFFVDHEENWQILLMINKKASFSYDAVSVLFMLSENCCGVIFFRNN